MSILSTAYSGLSAFQNALGVIGNNISNSATKGYTRQSIQLIPSLTQKIGNSYIGTGVNVSSVVRNADQFANYQVRNTLSVKSQYEAFFNQAAQVDQLLYQDGSSLSSSMQSFFSAVSQMNSNASDPSSRTVGLKQSQLLASQFNFLQGRLDQYQANSTTQIKQTVDQINYLSKDVARLNSQIIAAPDAPDLQDQRDLLMQQISEFADVTAVAQPNGTINLTFGAGQTLVAGTEQRSLSVSTQKSADNGTQILLEGQDVTGLFNSGALKGLLDFEKNVIGKSSQIIGQIAIGLSQAFNAQNSLGVDLNNQIGSNYFTDYNTPSAQQARSISSNSNTGTANLSVSISNIAQIKISDYDLTVVDAATNKYSLISKADGSTIPLTWNSSTSSAPATLTVDGTGATVVDGLTITVDDITKLADKDRFILQPTRGAASQFNVLLTDYKSIALASPVRAESTATNKGNASFSLDKVFNTSAVNNNYTITVDPADATKYTISGDPTVYTLSPGADNTIYLPPGSSTTNASYSVKLSGTPSAGDTFTLGFNFGAMGDNSNGLLLANIQQSKVI